MASLGHVDGGVVLWKGTALVVDIGKEGRVATKDGVAVWWRVCTHDRIPLKVIHIVIRLHPHTHTYSLLVSGAV